MKKRFFIILLALSVLVLSACSKREPDFPICHDIVKAISDNEISLPAGKIYYKSASAGEDGYIGDGMLSAVFGGGKDLSIFELWDDIAIFLPSSDHPCEIIAIHCASAIDTSDTALLLLGRLSDVRDAKNAKYPEYFLDCNVFIIKNYVLMIVSSDVKNALGVAKETIKGG